MTTYNLFVIKHSCLPRLPPYGQVRPNGVGNLGQHVFWSRRVVFTLLCFLSAILCWFILRSPIVSPTDLFKRLQLTTFERAWKCHFLSYTISLQLKCYATKSPYTIIHRHYTLTMMIFLLYFDYTMMFVPWELIHHGITNSVICGLGRISNNIYVDPGSIWCRWWCQKITHEK